MSNAILGVRNTEKNTDIELTLKRNQTYINNLNKYRGSRSNACYKEK